MSRRAARTLEALAVFAAVLLVLVTTAHHYGLGYDEPVYMSRAQEAAQWLRLLTIDPALAISDEGIRPFWEARSEQQPGFLKLWGAVTTGLASGLLPVLGALRVGTTLLVPAMCASMYLLVASLWGRLEAAASVGALLTMPRTFAHAHLFALDAPVMALTFVSLHLFFLCARERSWWWAATAAAVWGLAMSTKVNALFIPLIVVPWLALCARDALLPAIVCGAAVGPLCFFGSWPWLWHDTLARLGAYLRFHARHWQVHVTYFGTRYAPAPWHYPAVMTLITTPVVTLVEICLGAARMLRDRAQAAGAPPWRERWQDPAWQRRAAGALLGWALAVNYVLNSLPSTPKYTGVRLFQPVFPPLAVIAGVGIGWVARTIARYLRRRAGAGSSALPRILAVAVVVAALTPQMRAVAELHPHQMSYYNELIGGLAGAQRAG
ncbi:MAG: ArnT family glycosyltransferase, partial [Armatimonadota bacterium]